MEASKRVMKRTKTKTAEPKEPKETKTPGNAGSKGAIVEKNRRKQMKDLCLSLDALLPPPPPTTTASETQEKMVVLSTLDRSTGYVNLLKQKVEQLKRKRDGLKEDLVKADVQVNENDSVLEVNLVTGLNKGYILHKILSILQEEGARVLTANCSRLADKFVYTVVSQAFSPRIGIATSRVHERLRILSGMSTLSLAPAALQGESSSYPPAI